MTKEGEHSIECKLTNPSYPWWLCGEDKEDSGGFKLTIHVGKTENFSDPKLKVRLIITLDGVQVGGVNEKLTFHGKSPVKNPNQDPGDPVRQFPPSGIYQ